MTNLNLQTKEKKKSCQRHPTHRRSNDYDKKQYTSKTVRTIHQRKRRKSNPPSGKNRAVYSKRYIKKLKTNTEKYDEYKVKRAKQQKMRRSQTPKVQSVSKVSVLFNTQFGYKVIKKCMIQTLLE